MVTVDDQIALARLEWVDEILKIDRGEQKLKRDVQVEERDVRRIIRHLSYGGFFNRGILRKLVNLRLAITGAKKKLQGGNAQTLVPDLRAIRSILQDILAMMKLEVSDADHIRELLKDDAGIERSLLAQSEGKDEERHLEQVNRIRTAIRKLHDDRTHVLDTIVNSLEARLKESELQLQGTIEKLEEIDPQESLGTLASILEFLSWRHHELMERVQNVLSRAQHAADVMRLEVDDIKLLGNYLHHELSLAKQK